MNYAILFWQRDSNAETIFLEFGENNISNHFVLIFELVGKNIVVDVIAPRLISDPAVLRC